MKSQNVILELSHKYIKVLICDTVNGELAVRYVKKVKADNFINALEIHNENDLVELLSKLNPIIDEEYHINQLLDNVVLVLPSYGLEIFQTNQLTTVMSPEKVVGEMDIRNIYNIIRNKRLPISNELVNIYIDEYHMENGEVYNVAPLGKRSGSISAYAKVITLPGKVNNLFANSLSRAGIKVKQKVVSSIAANEFLKTDESLSPNYFLIDIGANVTTVSLIGKNTVVGSRFFEFGGSNLTDRLIERFNINEAQAEKIKEIYGIDNREMSFRHVVIKSNSGSFYKEDINKAFVDELEVFSSMLNASIQTLIRDYKIPDTFKFDFVLIGGGSQLVGLKEYIEKKFAGYSVVIYQPKIIGARDSSLVSLLGAAVLLNNYSDGIANLDSRVSEIKRDE